MAEVEKIAIESIKSDDIGDNLKAVIDALNNEQSVIKNLIASVRAISKNYERQSKDYNKLRNKKSRSSENKSSDTPCGITKPVAISDDLARFLGVEPGTLVPRNEVTKGVSGYVRKYELSDPTNKQKFVFGSKPEGAILKTLLGNPAEEVTYFNLQRYLKHHYIQTDKAVSTPKDTIQIPDVVISTTPATDSTDTASEPVKKKTVLVKKKKESQLQLTEDA